MIEDFLKYVRNEFGQSLTVDKSKKESFEDVFGIITTNYKQTSSAEVRYEN